MKFERHPLSVLGGDIPEAQFQELCADIEQHGQRFPIVIYGNTVLDGWHRFRACTYLEVKPKVEKFKGTPQQAAEFVVSANGHRRNHTDSQRAFFIAGCYSWVEQQGGAEPGSTPPKETKTNHELAKLANTSDRTIRQAKQVHRAGSRALKEAVQAGDISVKKAAAVVDLPKREQLKAATAKPEKPEEAAEPDMMPEPEPLSADEMAEMDEAAERARQDFADKVMGSDDRIAAAGAEVERLSRDLANMTRHRDHWMNQAGANAKFAKRLQGVINKKDREIAALRAQMESAAA